jgi:hypothetical protein
LPSPGWTPLCLCHLRLDHPGLKRTGAAPEVLRNPRGKATSGDFTPWGHPQVMSRIPSPNPHFFIQPLGLYHPATSLWRLLRWGFAPALLIPGPLPLGLSIQCLAYQGFEIHFLPSQGFDRDGLDLHWSLQAFSSSRLPHFVTLRSRPLPPQVASSRPQEDHHRPRG